MALELADIFRQYGPTYRQKYASRMPATHLKAMRAIEQCRTEVLGGQVYRCPNCEQVQYSYHSCRNRHCPKCQNENAQHWLEQQQAMLLPVPYFLLTFTLPAGFNEVAHAHQRLLYDLLFKTSAAATQQLAQEPRWLGGQVGMVGVLHTWGRNLAYHPHVHYLVPGGGLSTDGQSWLPARHNFLLPVRALSRVFRGKLQQALRHTACYARIPAKVWQQEWVVHCEAVGSGWNALNIWPRTFSELPLVTTASSSWKMTASRFVIAPLRPAQKNVVPWRQKSSSTVFSNMFCPKAL